MDQRVCAPSCQLRPAIDSTDGCRQRGWGLYEYPLAMVYAPRQAFRCLYDPETALQKGTLFSELDLPLESVNRRGGCGCQSRSGREVRS